MQSQQRAEAGITEIVIGYIGHEDEIDPAAGLETVQSVVGKIADAGIGPMAEVVPADLPEDIRAIYYAELHRIKTGELQRAVDFK